MDTARIKIVGERQGGVLRGADIRVIVVAPNGEELLLPAQSLVLRVGSRHEQAIATIEVPAVLVELQLDQSQLATVADVQPGGPESQWEASLGARPGEKLADVEMYAEPHRELIANPRGPESAWEAGVSRQPPLDARFTGPVKGHDHTAPVLPGPPLKVDVAAFDAATAPSVPQDEPGPEHVVDAAAALRASLGGPMADIDAIIANATKAPTS